MKCRILGALQNAHAHIWKWPTRIVAYNNGRLCNGAVSEKIHHFIVHYVSCVISRTNKPTTSEFSHSQTNKQTDKPNYLSTPVAHIHVEVEFNYNVHRLPSPELSISHSLKSIYSVDTITLFVLLPIVLQWSAS